MDSPLDHIVLPCTIVNNEILFNTIATADCGATASFIDSLFAQLHGLKFTLLQHLCDLTVADGRLVSLGAITHIVWISLAFEVYTKSSHIEIFDLFVTTLGQYPIVLGLP